LRVSGERAVEVTDDTKLPTFGIKDLLDKAQDAMRVSRVFGEAYERDGALLIPVASVRGGGGGGGGGQGDQVGEGGGFGLTATPVGVYIVKDGTTSWKPAWDINKFVAWGNLVALFYFFTVWRVQKARAKG
jgi:hypothetical protein